MRKEQGYIYLILSKYGYKIGRTNRPKQRFNLFGTSLPFSISIELCEAVNNPMLVERLLHKKFGQNRLNGEWFKLSKEDISDFKEVVSKYKINKVRRSTVKKDGRGRPKAQHGFFAFTTQIDPEKRAALKYIASIKNKKVFEILDDALGVYLNSQKLK